MRELILEKMEELEREFDEGTTELYVGVLTEYDSGYICDILVEIASNYTEIYTSNLFDMAWDLYVGGYTEIATQEIGETDLVRILQIADNERLYECLINNQKTMLAYFGLDKLLEMDTTAIRDTDREDFIEDLCSTLSEEDRLENIEDKVIDMVESYSVY